MTTIRDTIRDAKTGMFEATAEDVLASLGVNKPKTTDTEAVAAFLRARWTYLTDLLAPRENGADTPFTPIDGPFRHKYVARIERGHRGNENRRRVIAPLVADGWVRASDWNGYGVVRNRAHTEKAIERLVVAGVMESTEVTWEVPAFDVMTGEGRYQASASKERATLHRLNLLTGDLDRLLAEVAGDLAERAQRTADSDASGGAKWEEKARELAATIGAEASTANTARLTLLGRELEQAAKRAIEGAQGETKRSAAAESYLAFCRLIEDHRRGLVLPDEARVELHERTA